MTEQHSKARQVAEKAFDKTQASSAAGDRARDEVDAVTKARQEKTSRLREARLAMEAQNAADVSVRKT
ncbi:MULTISPECIES: hypothetical protein [Rhizobiaceae]|jgi:hypothetical protein|uniref:Uncharacterized protein n=1 Tax=Aliirhizobium cellulosilyticum TaxID=393664 RepID=A0A7W6Y0R6_9HYPH|nr:hypothetical protein [Rhizobium cellulosilyticum]MBB4348197.1 hypothetical protein [Rhizobium cellulosilyticum]MBB4411434.1 hypothetical protein [Rhizobium cellulosilyticum]MBB4446123.1 hypothetical protein [Rhizobium cellulosilyticum]